MYTLSMGKGKGEKAVNGTPTVTARFDLKVDPFLSSRGGGFVFFVTYGSLLRLTEDTHLLNCRFKMLKNVMGPSLVEFDGLGLCSK